MNGIDAALDAVVRPVADALAAVVFVKVPFFGAELPPGGQGAELEMRPAPGRRVVRGDEQRHVYRLRVASRRGHKPAWRGGPAEDFYLGAGLIFLGERGHLERDVFGVELGGCGVPDEVEAGESFRGLVRLRNTSAETWHASGGARVRLAHRWLLAGGGEKGGRRSDLRHDIEPGEEVSLWLDAEAPTSPGKHQLSVDLVYENVAYFADRRGETLCKLTVAVRAGDTPAGDGG